MVHPEIKNGGPPMVDFGPAQPIMMSEYLDKRYKDQLKRGTRSFVELMDAQKQFSILAKSIDNSFSPFITDFDREFVLDSTCAIGIWKPTHFSIEEIGFMGRNNEFTYPESLMSLVRDVYAGYLGPEPDSYTLPLGRNVGYPYPVGGLNRSASNALLATAAMLTSEFQDKGRSIQELMDFLTMYHGKPHTIYAERFQHHAKAKPVKLMDRWLETLNLECRTRAIYMDPKVMVMWMKKRVNRLLRAVLSVPFHDPNKPTIKKAIDKYLAGGFHVFSQDFSKFDQRHGGKRGRQLVQLAGDVLRDPTYVSDMAYNMSLPLPIPTHMLYMQRVDGPILTSGSADTTVRNCMGNLTGCSFAISRAFDIEESTVVKALSNSVSSELIGGLGYGDDGVLAISKKFGSRDAVMKQLQKGFAAADLEIDYEPSLKFLGFQYSKGEYGGSFDTGYPVGRFIQQQFFPERQKVFPFATIGFIARLALVTESKQREIFEVMKKNFWDETILGPKFDFNDRLNVLESLEPEIAKAGSKISQVDDILQIFLHGLDDTYDIEIPEEFRKFIGLTSIDFDGDTGALIESLDLEGNLNSIVKRFRTKGSAGYYPYASELASTLKLQWRIGQCLY
jgi:hypothetical protein